MFISMLDFISSNTYTKQNRSATGSGGMIPSSHMKHLKIELNLFYSIILYGTRILTFHSKYEEQFKWS